MIRNSQHPSLGTRTPARTEDFFDEAQLAGLRAYARPRKRVGLLARSLALVVDHQHRVIEARRGRRNTGC